MLEVIEFLALTVLARRMNTSSNVQFHTRPDRILSQPEILRHFHMHLLP